MDAILYVVRTGCSWRQLPVDFPPCATVYWHSVSSTPEVWPSGFWTSCVSRFAWRRDALRSPARGSSTRSPSRPLTPSTRRDARGYDAGKKINGRKRFIVSDTLGLHRAETRCTARLFDDPATVVVEQTLAWLTAHRRLARDRDHYPPRDRRQPQDRTPLTHDRRKSDRTAPAAPEPDPHPPSPPENHAGPEPHQPPTPGKR
jgi:transposase